LSVWVALAAVELRLRHNIPFVQSLLPKYLIG
jgi:hypothetical protein